MCPGGLWAARKSAAVNNPPWPTTLNCTPEFAAPAPDSCQTIWASSPTTTSSPGRVRILRPIWFAIVPLGTKRAASLPSNSAIRSCSRLTDGSSPYWSSPTGAAANAWRMPGEGRVTVSERRSMRSIQLQLIGELLGAAPRAREEAGKLPPGSVRVDDRAQHDAALLGVVIAGAAVHRRPLVPHQQIADLPGMVIG